MIATDSLISAAAAALLIWAAMSAVLANILQVTALAVVVIGRRRRRAAVSLDGLPALTMVRPLRGLEPEAEACNESLFEGDYQPAAVLFVVESEDDPAVAGARPTLARHPDRARLLVARPAPHIRSGKVVNMISGWEAADTPIVGFCDSDILLERDHLAACMREFADPRVAAASLPILYEADGPVGRLSMFIKTIDNATFVHAASHTGIGVVTLGGLMLFRKDGLDAVGGPAVLGDALADDLRAGELLSRAAYRIRLANAVLTHRSGPESAWSCLARHHRWMVSIRTEIPAYFWIQLLGLNPILPTLGAATALSLMGSTWAPAAWGIFAGNAILRTAVAAVIDRILLRPYGMGLGAWSLARLPADILYLLVAVTTLVFPFVYWRGRWFRVMWGSGRILHEAGRSQKADGVS